MADDIIPPGIMKMSFEEALSELELIVREMEGGRGDLDEAINAYARGAHLKLHCENKPKDAQARVEKIVVGSANGSGDVVVEPLDAD